MRGESRGDGFESIRLGGGGPQLGEYGTSFRKEIVAVMGLSQMDRFKSERHSLLMLPAGAITLGETESRVDRAWFSSDHVSQDLLPLSLVPAE